MPAQLVPVRPSGVMAICSGKTRPKPPAARDPISMRWKSPIRPSTDRYMVIGDIAIRLRSVMPLRVKGLKRSGIGQIACTGCASTGAYAGPAAPQSTVQAGGRKVRRLPGIGSDAPHLGLRADVAHVILCCRPRMSRLGGAMQPADAPAGGAAVETDIAV